MTENEAMKNLETLERFYRIAKSGSALHEVLINFVTLEDLVVAIQALEEIQQYRAIGTVEDIQKVLSFLGDENKRSIIDDLKLLNEYKATGLTPELIEAMQGHNVALINDLGEYQAIGTVEDIQEVMALCKSLQETVCRYMNIGTIEEFQALKEKEERFDRNIRMFNEIGLEIRAKAIDEFAEKLKEKSTFLKSIENDYYGYVSEYEIDDVAEQMKAGGIE